jgi:hypothetical protein
MRVGIQWRDQLQTDLPEASRIQRHRAAFATAFAAILVTAIVSGWLLWPVPVHAPAKQPPTGDRFQPAAEVAVPLELEEPSARTVPLKRVTLTPEEDLRGPALSYVQDPEDLHQVQLQRIAALAPGLDATDGILSFANAVMMAGNTWTITPDRMSYLRLGDTGAQAYTGVGNPHEIADTPQESVALRPYEQEGLALLKKGHGVVWRFEEYGLHALGSLRNSGQCLACHQQPEGSLLGAISYVYEEWADD